MKLYQYFFLKHYTHLKWYKIFEISSIFKEKKTIHYVLFKLPKTNCTRKKICFFSPLVDQEESERFATKFKEAISPLLKKEKKENNTSTCFFSLAF